MPPHITLLCVAVGLFVALNGFLYVLFPRKSILIERRFYHRIHLISAGKLQKPVKQRAVVLRFLDGWISLAIGIILLRGFPIQLSLCCNDAGRSDYIHTLSGSLTDSTLTDLKAKVNKVIQPLISSRKSVGVSVGILQRENSVVLGYGRANSSSNSSPNGDTIYEIGSITKVFTSLTLARTAEDGLVDFNDPVGEFLPPSVQMPVYNGRQIKLIDLATHTSGLPRVPDNSHGFKDYITLDFINNPYASYTPLQLHKFLSKHTPKDEPGAKFCYSNLGIGLLGYTLANSRGITFEEMVLNDICSPLGMNDTRITLSPEQKFRLAGGYRGVWAIPCLQIYFPAKNWDIPTLAGAGALRSTVNDMLKFLSANMGITQMPLWKLLSSHGAQLSRK